MGDHYTPRAHLRRFKEGDPDMIWMYDKQTRQFCHAGIASVAQEVDYYEDDVEKTLAQEIERPSNGIITKMLGRKKLDNEERSRLTLYMLTMSTRGPRLRRKQFEHAPEALESVAGEVRERIQSWADENAEDADFQKDRLQEVDKAAIKFKYTMPDNVVKQIRRPFYSLRTVECLHTMHWHILPAPEGSHFITSDTPAHFFESIGLGNPTSEFTFPISKDFALIGDRQNLAGGQTYLKPDAQFVKEVNRRILSVTERFVFSTFRESWIDTVAQKKDPYLSLIRWT